MNKAPEARLARAGLALSAAYLAPERATVVYKATCPMCGRERALRLRTVAGRLRLQTRCGCDGVQVWDAIDSAAEFNLGEGWGLGREEFEIVTGVPPRRKLFTCHRARLGGISCPGSRR